MNKCLENKIGLPLNSFILLLKEEGKYGQQTTPMRDARTFNVFQVLEPCSTFGGFGALKERCRYFLNSVDQTTSSLNSGFNKI